MHADSTLTAYAGVDHEGSLCSCCLDCLEDVHSSFNFDPLNFSHTSDEHTTAGHSITEKKVRMNMMRELCKCEGLQAELLLPVKITTV